MLVNAERQAVTAFSGTSAATLAAPAMPGGVAAARPASHAPPSRSTPATSSTRYALRTGLVLITLLALGCGWLLASQEVFIPKEGAGYWLGISGGTALLVQLAYPLRKRARFMRRLGSAPAWFRLHMLLGIAGPLLILYHSNFSLGATNSNVALFAMLFVAASGIVGRYFYGKIHNGLYGAHTNIQDLLSEATGLLRDVEHDVGGAGGSIAARLTEFATRVLRPRQSLAANLGMAMWLGLTLPFVRWRLVSTLR